MRNALFLLSTSALIALTGCIIYEEGSVTHHHRGDRDDRDDRDDRGDETLDDEALDDEADALDCQLELDPYEVTAGEAFIGYMSAAEDVFAIGIDDVILHGGAALEAWDPRSEEIVLSVLVDGDAAGTTVDAEVVLSDGQSCWLEPAFGVSEAISEGDSG